MRAFLTNPTLDDMPDGLINPTRAACRTISRVEWVDRRGGVPAEGNKADPQNSPKGTMAYCPGRRFWALHQAKSVLVPGSSLAMEHVQLPAKYSQDLSNHRVISAGFNRS